MNRSTFILLRSTLAICKRQLHKEVVNAEEKCISNTDKIRNIGILAHIDAGKTTTTERMLYYSGFINTMGEVHHGNTVTDYMDQERNRGITITSAAVTFNWNGHRVNLIDTPGHIDFTMEVEQTLQVLDGAIVIMDASAGVEAQTLTVWKQADSYKIPRLVFLNKMDRKDADLDLCIKSIQTKLIDVTPLLLQVPIKDKAENLIGLVNLVTMEKLLWKQKNIPEKEGKEYLKEALIRNEDEELWNQATKARNSLIEKLADLDDVVAEQIIVNESMDSITNEILLSSINRATVCQKGVPILCGSAYRNTGVQPLMDAVIQFLPSPSKRLLSDFESRICSSFGDNLFAKAFKVIHSDQKGPLTFIRIYSGKFKKGQKIYNLRSQKSELTSRLMMASADDYEEIEDIECGNIAVISGLKETVTGDMITSSTSAAKLAKLNLMKVTDLSEDEVDEAFSKGANIPDPVFFCSVEPASQAYQNSLDKALSELVREDPSLRVSLNQETGQTVLGGMGELHLDIIKERLTSEYKIDVDLGPLQIAYKETPVCDCKDSFTFSHKIGTSIHEVNLTLSLHQNKPVSSKIKNEKLKSVSVPLTLDKSPDSAANIAAIKFKQLQAVKQGVEVGLSHGPKLSCPVVDAEITLHWLEVRKGTSETIIASSVTQAVQKLLKKSGTILMEPIMELEVVLNSEDKLRVVLADLSRRRILHQEVETRGNQTIVHVLAPLVELLGYSTDLRTISSGTASFSMEFHCYREMSTMEESTAIRNITGF